MRVSQKPNRSRGRGNRKPGGNNVNRVFESSGPEGKVRGTPQQIIEKYISLARDAQTSGNRVVAENFLQHAEHYQRILVEAMGARPERRDNEQPDTEQPEVNGADAGDGDRAKASNIQPGEEATPQEGRGNGRRDRGGGDRARDRGSDRAGDRSDNRGNGRRQDRDPRDSEVSGLTTIDSGGEDSGSLLVEAEDLSASQPATPPNRRRRREPAPEAETAPEARPAATETDTQPE